MPTLIGRFNDLLHQLSSSSSSTATAAAVASNAATTTTTTSTAVPSPTHQSANTRHQHTNARSHHHHHSNNCQQSELRPNAVKRSSSLSSHHNQHQQQQQQQQHRTKSNQSRGQIGHRVLEQNYTNATTTTNHSSQPRSRQRVSSGAATSSKNQQLQHQQQLQQQQQQHRSHSAHTSNPSRSRRDITTNGGHHHHQNNHNAHQSHTNPTTSTSSSSSRRHSSSRRRHSVASVAGGGATKNGTTAKNCPPIDKKEAKMVNSGKTGGCCGSTTTKDRTNNEPSQKSMDTNRIINNILSTNNHGNNRHHNTKATTTTANTMSNGKDHAKVASSSSTRPATGKHSNGVVGGHSNNKTANSNNNNNPTVMRQTQTSAGSEVVTNNNNNLENEESLASRLARKMKISTITRKGSSCGTQNGKTGDNIRKHFKFHKKSSETKTSKTTESEETQGCFISQYLNGYLNKQHPDVISGKTCYDLPIKDVQPLESQVVASYTGPKGGLVKVHIAAPKPFDLADDVDYIDEDYPDSSLSSAGAAEQLSPHTNKSSSSNVSSDGRLTASDGTGSPNSGYQTNSNSNSNHSSNHKEPIAGVFDWDCGNEYAYGVSNSLYESHPTTKKNAGDPIADSFAMCVRENSAILTLADGVNWGERACLASRCAIYGCMEYLNNALYSPAESTRIKNTMDIYVALLRSFNAAHNLILAQGGHLTTLCAAVICQLKNSERFVVCTCNVGDSLAYVYSPVHGIREITQESHDIFSMRDMRDALGALGPVSGCEPELNNLTVAMTIVDAGDIVFLTSDGISDNFDPVVGKFAMPRKELPEPAKEEEKVDCAANQPQHSKKKGEKEKNKEGDTTDSGKVGKKVQRSNSNPERGKYRANYTSKGLPLVSAQQRHALTLLRMEDLIVNGVGTQQPQQQQQLDNVDGRGRANNQTSTKLTARGLCDLMMEFSTKLTMAKRHILEDPELYPDDDEDGDGSEAFVKQRNRRRQVGGKLMQMPGKLDHATIAAVEVGFYGKLASGHKRPSTTTSTTHVPFNARKDYARRPSDARYDLRAKATLARFESQDSLDYCTESALI